MRLSFKQEQDMQRIAECLALCAPLAASRKCCETIRRVKGSDLWYVLRDANFELSRLVKERDKYVVVKELGGNRHEEATQKEGVRSDG